MTNLHLIPTLLCVSLATAQSPLAKKPDTTQAVTSQIQTAESALEKGDFTTAVTLLKTLSGEQPKNAQIAYDLGYAEERTGDDAAASAAYKGAMTIAPEMAEATIALGLLDARTGHSEEAREYLQKGVSLTGAAPELRGRALRALAALDQKKNPAAAQDELLEAVKLTGETPEDIGLSAHLAARAGDSTDAESAYRRVLSASPDDPSASADLASLLSKEGKNAEAQTVLESAMKAHPNDPQLIAGLVVVYEKAGKPSEAVELLAKARQSDPSLAANPQVTRMLARLDVMAGKDADAVTLYSDLAAKNATDPVLLDEYGGALVKADRFAEAQAVFTKAVEMRAAFPTPEDWAEAESHLAFAASKNHQPGLALQALSLRATVLPNSPSSLFLQAISYDALHKYGEAAKAYRAFLAVAQGKFPDQEFQARHRLIALDHMK